MTRAPWPLVPLGDVLRQVSEGHRVDGDKEYPNFGIYSFGRGLFRKQPISGTMTSARTLFLARRGCFIYSRLFAFEGAYGLVSDEFHGSFVSNEYPMFETEAARLAPEYLATYFRLPAVWEEVAKGAVGMGDRRRRVQPEHLLRHSIPLPPLPEQRRIVAKLDHLSAKVEAVKRLVVAASSEADSLRRAVISDTRLGSIQPTPMSELVALRQTDVEVEGSSQYQFAGVYCFGRGLFRAGVKSGLEFAYKRLTRLRGGDFTYPKLMAWEGALAVVPLDCEGLCVSPEFPVFSVNRERVLPEVLDVHFRSPSVWPELSGASTGTNVRRRRLHPDAFLAYRFPLPSARAQRVLQEVHQRLLEAEPLRHTAAAELDALLPAILDRAFKGEL